MNRPPPFTDKNKNEKVPSFLLNEISAAIIAASALASVLYMAFQRNGFGGYWVFFTHVLIGAFVARLTVEKKTKRVGLAISLYITAYQTLQMMRSPTVDTSYVELAAYAVGASVTGVLI